MSTTPNMSLIVPEPLVTTGPTYATQINSTLDVIDAHDHSAGKGVRVTPSGLNINADLPFNQNSATNLKAVVLAPQASVSTNAALYNVGGDLFYRRGDGTQVQITTAGGVNVSGVGGITGLTSPASAVYTPASSLFSWLSGASTFAKQATGDLSIYSRSGAIGVVQAVTMVADVATSAYSLYLPATGPTDNQIMRMTAASASKFVTLQGTNNQVTVTHNANDTTLALPQNIHTGATPTFAGLTLTGALSGVTTGSFSGQVNVGTLVSAGDISGTTGTFSSHVSGVNGTFTGDVSGVNATFSGNLDLTGFLKTITGTFVDATLRSVTTSLNISSTSGTISANNFSCGSTSLNQLSGVTTNQIIISGDIFPSVVGAGVNIIGKFDGNAFSAGRVGQVITQGMAGNVNASTSYQNLIAYQIGAGCWEITTQTVVTWNVGNNTARVRAVDCALSLTTAAADSATYTSSQIVPAYGWAQDISTLNTLAVGESIAVGESLSVITITRRVNVASPTFVYLVGKTRTYFGGTNNVYFNSTGTIIKAQRVG